MLAAAPVDQPRRGASHPAASHVEAKAAVWLRQNKITYAVLVINHRKGPCGEQEDQADDPYTCAVVVRAILPVGTTMVLWWSDQDGRMVSVSYEGAAT
ncbi:MAG TPA: DddA-like double-stranded DNA deaminase toxin [Actinophytocola sp.]|uniref:DddA-like double-stranded DNA deaminase toxin n=1 Tax=Actinophytocola sp. TaxID=1872138 RepID=UPI002E061C36|nr:DddA-like double-stranded DNA deaminase toxin [Actinophytocola sp.]